LASRIPNEFINELLERIDIVDVISPRVSLKKAGRDYQALCPFHAENTPSFTVSPNKQFYHCFGCGKHGTAIGFLMEYEGLDFLDAVESLAQMAGVEVPRRGARGPGDNHANLYAITDKARRLFQNDLANNAEAQAYLRRRGLDAKTIQAFQIGSAPDAWDYVLRSFSPAEQPLLMTAGLITQNESGKTYDKFRRRILFPIHDRRGRVIAFGGRALGDDQMPKYLNSPETPLFHKGRELYGLHHARKHGDSKTVLVVEGYMDVVILHQHGFTNAVATLGTATTPEHVTVLTRYFDKVVFCFDGDKAGRKAAWKALESALPHYRDDKSLKFVFLPQGEDPDSYVSTRGEAAFQEVLDKAVNLSDVLLKGLQKDLDLDTLDDRARFIERARPYIRQLPKGQFRKLMAQHIEELTHAEIDWDAPPSGRHLSSRREHTSQAQNHAGAESTTGDWSPVRKAIALVIQNPSAALGAPWPASVDNCGYRGAAILQELLENIRANPQINTAALLESWRGRGEYPHLNRLAACDLMLTPEQASNELRDVAAYLQQAVNRNKIEGLRRKQAQTGLNAEEQQELLQLLASRVQRTQP